MKLYSFITILSFILNCSVVFCFGQTEAEKENQLGQVDLEQQNFQTSLEHFTKAAQLNPENQNYCQNAAIAASNLSNPYLAVEWLKKAVDIAIEKSEYRQIEEFNEQISRILDKWPAWAEQKTESAYSLPDESENMLEQVYQFIEQAKQEHQNKNIEKSMLNIQQAFDIAKKNFGETHPETLDILRIKAEFLADLNRHAEAEELYRNLFSQFSSVLGDSHPQSVKILKKLSELYFNENKPDSASSVLSQALSLSEKGVGEKHPDTIAITDNLALILDKQKRFDESEPLFAKALKLCEEAFGIYHPNTLVCLEDYANHLESVNKFEQAQEKYEILYKNSLAIFGEYHQNSLNAYAGLGRVLRSQGLFRQAEECFADIYGSADSVYGKNNEITITAMNNLALIYEDQGLYEKAEPLFKNALAASEKVLTETHTTTLALMNNLAMLYESQGLFDKACLIYQSVISTSSKSYGKNHDQTVAAMNNLAYLYLLEEQYQEAQSIFADVVSIWEKTLSQNHPNTLKAMNNLARSIMGLKLYDKAESMLVTLLEKRTSVLGKFHADTIRTMIDLGNLYQNKETFQQSEKILSDALILAEQGLGNHHPYTFEILNALSKLYEKTENKQKEFDLKKQVFERRNEFFRRVLWMTGENAREGYIKLHKKEQDSYISTLIKTNSPVASEELLKVCSIRKGLLLKISSEIKQVLQMSNDPVLKEKSQTLMTKKKELATLTLSGASNDKPQDFLLRMNKLENEINDIQAELGQSSATYQRKIQPVSPENISKALDENQILIDFITYLESDSKTTKLASVVTRSTKENRPRINIVDLGNLEPIKNAIDELRRTIKDEDSDKSELKQAGRNVFDLLWKPLVALLENINTVYLVPDNILNILPFDAIADETGKYLISSYQLITLTSSNNIVCMSEPTSSPVCGSKEFEKLPPETSLYIIAGPDYNATTLKQEADFVISNKRTGELSDGLRIVSGLRGLSFDRLPGAEQEGKKIESICKPTLKTELISKAKAEEQQIRKMPKPPEILHIATHGFFLKEQENLIKRLLKAQRGMEYQVPPPGDNPLLRAGLAFAGINKNAPFFGEVDPDNDGILTAQEVLDINLIGTYLVVLSACETGLGEIQEGEGVYGLRRSFQEAGAKSVINSLWEVSDIGTQALMSILYKRLLEKNISPRAAFRQAKLEMLANRYWDHPYFWAAFVMVE